MDNLTDEHLIELFNERAGICEHCGGLPKWEAEIAAYYEIKKLVGRCNGVAVVLPKQIRSVVRVAMERLVHDSITS